MTGLVTDYFVVDRLYLQVNLLKPCTCPCPCENEFLFSIIPALCLTLLLALKIAVKALTVDCLVNYSAYNDLMFSELSLFVS